MSTEKEKERQKSILAAQEKAKKELLAMHNS